MIITVNEYKCQFIIQRQMDNLNQFFPSFAASPTRSQRKQLSSTQQDNPVHRITIHLPQSFVESTADYNYSIQSSVKQTSQPDGSNIKVFCRFKPSQNPSVIRYDENMIDDGQNKYSFDVIFNQLCEQEQVFSAIGWRHIDTFFKGQNSTIFTYGQTGSGKTFTMFGDLKNREGYGLMPRTLQSIFTKKNEQDVITCSMLQIYNQKLKDLFDPLNQSVDGVKLKQINDLVILQGLVQVRVENHLQIMDLIRCGYRDRKIASTYNNEASSRSHTILFVYRQYHSHDKERKTKMCFIDLAGSEKIRKSGVKGQTLEETKKINLSLSCLGNVVSALTCSAEHIPYRNCKLTRILKDSLSGDCRTSIITTCSMDKTDYHETISTIKFAVRAKKIKNKKRLSNASYTPEQIIDKLKKQLAETKKELAFYKNKEEEQNTALEQVPEEEVVCRPINQSIVVGNGLSSRVKLGMTDSTHE